MKKIIVILTIAVALTSCQESQKIAYVDSTKVYEEYQEKIDIEERLKKKQEAFKKKTDSIGMAYQIEAGPLQAKVSKMSPQQQQNNAEIAAFSQKWQLIEGQIKAEEQSIQQQVDNDLKELETNVEEFITDFAKKNNYSFVLGKNQSGGLIYGDATSDITETVIKELNASYNGTSENEKTEETPVESPDK